LVLIIGGLLRLGRIADLFSRPILAGAVFGSGSRVEEHIGNHHIYLEVGDGVAAFREESAVLPSRGE
jgi:hypothetical protein